jgi:hypothetical protein
VHREPGDPEVKGRGGQEWRSVPAQKSQFPRECLALPKKGTNLLRAMTVALHHPGDPELERTRRLPRKDSAATSGRNNEEEVEGAGVTAAAFS